MRAIFMEVRMKSSYANLLHVLPQEVAETKFPYEYLTERHLQVMWYEQKYFKNLTTEQGLPIEVVSPGLWNGEAGPDFLKAHLIIGGQTFLGDVEIHLNAESWTQHHHHQDNRYNNVILHISLWQTKNPKTIVTNQGREIIQAFFEPSLSISHSRILQLIDLDLYPYKKFVGSGRCAHALFKTLPEASAIHFFTSAATWRLIQKRQLLKARVDNPTIQVGAGIATSFGYKNNAETFFELYIHLIKKQQLPEEEILALALGLCGFFASPYQEKWNTSEKYRSLKSLFEQNQDTSLTHFPLKLAQIRPLNHPIRRLAALAKIIKDPQIPGLGQAFELHWKDNWPMKQWGKLRVLLCDLIPTYQDAYWNRHYTFEEKESPSFLPLIGEDLKKEILVNTCLPLFYEQIEAGGEEKEHQAFIEFYRSFPASKTGKTKYLTHRFFGDTIKGNILRKGCLEQGAYQLHRDFCLHYEASCEGCPFVERFFLSCSKFD